MFAMNSLMKKEMLTRELINMNFGIDNETKVSTSKKRKIQTQISMHKFISYVFLVLILILGTYILYQVISQFR